MAHVTPGSEYTIQPNDTLSSIAQQAYGKPNDWPVIYNANRQLIGPDHNLIKPGEVIFIPKTDRPVSNCTVTASAGINVRAEATSNSTLVSFYPHGTILNYFEVVHGEDVNGNVHWGHSVQDHYFWMGATDHPNG